MQNLWDSRLRYFSALIWWISIRYFSIGWEYIFHIGGSSHYWSGFADIAPSIVGAVMVAVGATGITSQLFSWWTGFINARLAIGFAMGVCATSLFRIAVLLQDHRFGDPLLILFLCDFLAMLLVLPGLPYRKKPLRCQ
jgi:hypothetical protein